MAHVEAQVTSKDSKEPEDLLKPYHEGFKGFQDGKLNPYSSLSDNGIKWQRGFNTAKFGSVISKSFDRN